jgi:uroporphyrin-III C-methyltransferase/precorrin-2 dehydrogenase/sirohydrochlorin ferrochelatase
MAPQWLPVFTPSKTIGPSSSMTIYPLGLRIAGKRTLVVGGGAVGTRRAIGLLAAEAEVVVISPVISAELTALAQTGQITWLDRGFEAGDTAGAWLVHTATGVAEVDAQVAAEAEANRILCVNAAVAEDSTAWVPAVVRHDGLTVASFGGGDPRRSMALRDAIRTLLEAGELAAPREREVMGAGSGARGGAQQPGTVALVGGGPGHAGLITARGLELLKNADVVVSDRLGPTQLLDELAPTALVINVGKMPDHHPIPQEEINQILVAQALAGKKVVRLKGGDPYVLGRGGEELKFCAEHGVQVEVVPGVTSAISVPAAVGIPVTHRGVSTGFTVITGHEALQPIAGGRDHTVVILMGVNALKESAAALASGERGVDCPVAIIEDGYGENQRVSFGTLGTIAGIAKERKVQSPAIIVVGDVVLQSEFAPAELAGKIELRK